MAKAQPAQIYQIKVSIDGIEPPVWRRVLVSDKITLFKLHQVIQGVFDWEDYHLHEFTINGTAYGDPANDEARTGKIKDERRVRISKLDLKEGSKFSYVYDFGDGWEHTLVVEKILPYERGIKLPRIIAGERAAPPEDSGGWMGYMHYLEALRNPKRKANREAVEWIGEDFDPEAFDLDEANQRLSEWLKGYGPDGQIQPEEESADQEEIIIQEASLRKLTEQVSEAEAEALPLRKDVISFLNYLKENKVTGTQSTGNLPRKAVAGIAARFVNPPKLETSIGDKVFRFQSEDEVWPVYFVHVLASVAVMVTGGQSRIWRLTPQGEIFLSAPPIFQVWLLFRVWWHFVNWLIAYPLTYFGDELPPNFRPTAQSLLLQLPVDQPTNFEDFVNWFIEKADWNLGTLNSDRDRFLLKMGIEQMVIQPLEEFGILTTQYEQNPDRNYGLTTLVSFTKTRFGQALLESVAD